MAIEYTVYFKGHVADLESKILAFLEEIDAQAVFPMHGLENVDQFQRDILNEEGFPSDFKSQVWFRADKARLADAADAIRRLRDEVLMPDNSLALVNGEAELPNA